MEFAVVDIETTGGSPKYDKITEIAVFVHNGLTITDEFVSLINPERPIPAFITRMTGITDEMVSKAPKFYEIARRIVELTENRVFVAHNVNFDYNFIKSEFESLGFSFKRDKLCTVVLSRKAFPGYKSYSLGNITSNLGIKIKNRHRAAGDALATVRLLELINSKNPSLLNNNRFSALHPALDLSKVNNLPEEPGVYYLYNENSDIIYIGKSINIRERVYSHLHNGQTKRLNDMKFQVADIGYELTGSDLIALLKESEEIKKFKPRFNRLQRRSLNNWGIYTSTDDQGYTNLNIEKNNRMNSIPLSTFESHQEALKVLSFWVEKFNLCQKLSGLYKSDNYCFHYHIGQCRGACNGVEPVDSYNKRVDRLIESLAMYNRKSFFIIDRGKNELEKSVIKIENGKYIGYGYTNAENATIDNLHDCIKKNNDNRDVQSIIKQYLAKNKVEKIIPF